MTEQELQKKLKNRMLAFYFAGVVNLVIGLYVLFYGAAYMSQGAALLVALFFIGFAALDFYFPRMMQKRWWEEQQRTGGQGGMPPKS
jgi:hypothetical protein